jgi:hypothetical protein
MAHFLLPDHSEKFLKVLDRHQPGWRVTRQSLNETELLPLPLQSNGYQSYPFRFL